MASREFGTFRIDADVDSDDEQEKFSNLRLDVEVRTAEWELLPDPPGPSPQAHLLCLLLGDESNPGRR